MHLILQNFNTCNASTHNVGCPKVKWLHLRGEVDKSLRFSCQISSGFNVPKVIKIFSFSTELFKKKKMDVFLGHGVAANGSDYMLLARAFSKEFFGVHNFKSSCMM